VPKPSKLLRYLLVGGTAYLAEISVLWALHYPLGLNALISTAISFWVGFLIAFLLQKIFTFQNHDRRRHVVARQLVIYSLLVGWNYIFTLLMVASLEDKLSVIVIRTLVILATTVWNFAIYKQIFPSQTK
jgi:putative flippase GtrA